MLDQIASAFGLLLDVDWQGMFKSFYELVKIKVQCRDYLKIPAEKMYKVNGKLFLVKLHAETDTLVEDDVKNSSIIRTNKEDQNKQSGQQNMDTGKKSGQIQKNSNSTRSSSVTSGFSGGRTVLSNVPVKNFDTLHQKESDCHIQQHIDASLEEVKEDIMAWLDVETGDQESCSDLLRQMELADEEGVTSYDYEFGGQEEVKVEGEPLNYKRALLGPAPPTGTGKKQKQWGPILVERHGSRVNLGGKTMLEIAHGLQKKKNLEVPNAMHNKLKDLVASLKANQEMGCTLQKPYECLGDGVLPAHSRNDHVSCPADVGVKLNPWGLPGPFPNPEDAGDKTIETQRYATQGLSPVSTLDAGCMDSPYALRT